MHVTDNRFGILIFLGWRYGHRVVRFGVGREARLYSFIFVAMIATQSSHRTVVMVHVLCVDVNIIINRHGQHSFHPSFLIAMFISAVLYHRYHIIIVSTIVSTIVHLSLTINQADRNILHFLLYAPLASFLMFFSSFPSPSLQARMVSSNPCLLSLSSVLHLQFVWLFAHITHKHINITE